MILSKINLKLLWLMLSISTLYGCSLNNCITANKTISIVDNSPFSSMLHSTLEKYIEFNQTVVLLDKKGKAKCIEYLGSDLFFTGTVEKGKRVGKWKGYLKKTIILIADFPIPDTCARFVQYDEKGAVVRTYEFDIWTN